jgi:glucan phosphoethanolaminetransferase (alkaline phosphatase superfamily)
MKRFKRVINIAKDVLLVTAGVVINIFTVIIVALCVIAPPFIVTAVICYYFPFTREPIIFESIAIVMFVLWLAVIIYVFDPIFDRLEDKWFRESAKEIVAYKSKMWSAKLKNVVEDEVEE